MDGWTWAALVIATASMVGLVWWKRRARRVYVVDHVTVDDSKRGRERDRDALPSQSLAKSTRERFDVGVLVLGRSLGADSFRKIADMAAHARCGDAQGSLHGSPPRRAEAG